MCSTHNRPGNATHRKCSKKKIFVQPFNKHERRLFDFRCRILSFFSFKPRSPIAIMTENNCVLCNAINSSYHPFSAVSNAMTVPSRHATPTPRYSFPLSSSAQRPHSNSAPRHSQRTRTGSWSSPGFEGSWAERRGHPRLVHWKCEMEQAGGRKLLLRTS